jgi:hypothetical protein
VQRAFTAFITAVRIGAPLEQKADDLELRIQRHVRDGLVVVVVVVLFHPRLLLFHPRLRLPKHRDVQQCILGVLIIHVSIHVVAKIKGVL